MGCVQACLLDLAGGSPARRPAPRARRTLLEDTFRFIDTDSSGFIDMDELVSFGAFTGRNWTPEYVRVLLKSIDTDGDGQVSPDEFLAFCDKEVRARRVSPRHSPRRPPSSATSNRKASSDGSCWGSWKSRSSTRSGPQRSRRSSP